MIDVEEDVFDEMARLVLAEYPQAYVSGENVEVPASFPAVSIVETVNSAVAAREDSSGEENAAALTYTVNVFSNSASAAKRECKAILGIIDGRMRLRNMARSFARRIDNAADPSIHRMTARYTGAVGKNEVHYRR